MTGQSDADLAASIFGEQADESQHPESEAEVTPAEEVVEEEPIVEEEPKEELEEEPAEEKPAEERLFAGKYKTVEDMEKAYLESQKNFHAGRQEQGALKREIEEIKSLLVAKPQEQPKQPTPQEQAQNAEVLRQRLMYEPEKVIEEMAEARARNIVDTKLSEVLGPVLPSIQRQARADQISQQVQQYWADHPDHEPYKEAMAEIITQNPQLMRDPNWIGQTYLMAKIADLETKLNNPGKPAQKKVDPAQKKAAAVSASAGVKAAAVGEKKSDEDLLKDKLFGSAQEGRAMFDF
jgi:protein tyrosine phosphatase (PTP) superfamily phosphohydrolase (DUF442 family)